MSTTVYLTECQEWSGKAFPNGYGRKNFKIGTKWTATTAHRWTWIQEHGEIPEGLVVRHKCDNPLCVNLEHLELGTHKDNEQDKVDRGRFRGGMLPGEAHVLSKLSHEDIEFIRFAVAEGSKQKPLMDKFGISQSHVSNIVRGVRW